jgi:molecular chaperone GrpE
LSEEKPQREEKLEVAEREEQQAAEAAAAEQAEPQAAAESAEGQAGGEQGAAPPGPEAEASAPAAEPAVDYKALAAEYENRMLRALADMENMRRRFRKEQEDLAKYASLKVIEALLPALDNFERALTADKETLTVESLLKGVEMVYRQIQQVFEQEGLALIEAQGKPFDPNVHQAVMKVEDSNFASGTVVEVLQKGYMFKDRVLRPAMVKVNG